VKVAKSLKETDRRALLEEMSTLEVDADISPEAITRIGSTSPMSTDFASGLAATGPGLEARRDDA